jgi:NADPH:quinone reductase-like Zn-dependent oxidoreductase
MKKYQLLEGSTDLDSLQLVDCAEPVPADGQVLVRVHATSLNYRDYAVVTGNYFGGVLKRDTVPLSSMLRHRHLQLFASTDPAQV